MKLRPSTSGCSVAPNAPTRHNGTPAATRRSQVCFSSAAGFGADRAPSISQTIISLSSRLCILTDLATMAEGMIRQHARHHGFADRPRADADAGVVTPLGHDIGVGPVAVHGAARREDRRRRLYGETRHHRLPGRDAAE